MHSVIGNISAVILVTVFVFTKFNLPDYITVCRHDHQNLSACIIDAIDHLRPRLLNGIKDIEVPPMEPLELDPVSFDSMGSASRIAYNLSNIHVWGASKFQILKLTPKLTKNGYTFRFQVVIPKLHVEGTYYIDSKILFVVLNGNGPFNASISDYKFECIMKGEKVERNGTNHLQFENIKLTIGFGEASLFLDNLFNGNQVLGKATNAVLNDHSQILFEEVKPGIQHGLEKLFTDIANKITFAFTYEELFP